MQVFNFEQHSDEWFNIRLGKLTASHASTIYTGGKGMETLCFQLAAEILTGKKADTFQSAAMIQGNELEDCARTLFELETGLDVEQVGFVQSSDFVGCSPDGFIKNRTSGIEIKCPQDNTYAKYLYDKKIKPEYYGQMQMQMLVTNCPEWYYVVYNPNFEDCIQITKVTADHDYMDKLADNLIKGSEMIKEILKTIEKNRCI